MRVELPSGKGWIEVRDALTAADKWAVDGCYDLTVSDEGNVVIPGNAGSLKMRAFLERVITAWSFEGVPIPSQNIGGAQVIATAIPDLDDYNYLEEQVAPLFEKVNKAPNRRAAQKNGGRSNG